MKILNRFFFELEWFYFWITGKIPNQGDNTMTTTNAENAINPRSLTSKEACYDAYEAGQITFAEMRARCDEIEREEALAAYSVKISPSGRFYISGPGCSQSLTAAQVLGILAVREQIQDLARRYFTIAPHLKKMTSSNGEKYNQWFQGPISLTTERSLRDPHGILEALSDLA